MRIIDFTDMKIIPHNFIQAQSKERIGEVFFVDYVPEILGKGKAKIQLTHHIICLLKQGTKHVHSPSNVFEINSNTGFILQKGYYLMSEHFLENSGYQSFLVFFDTQQVNDFLQKYTIQRHVTPTTLNPTYPLFQFQLKPTYHAFVDSLQAILSNPILTVEMATLKLEELFLMMLDQEPEFREVLFALSTTKEATDFVQNINSKLFDQVTLDDLAFLNNMSLSTFKRKFKEQFKDSPGHYIKQKRMEKAASLLTYSGKSPSEIYLNLGYQNLSSFIDAFKSVFQITPAKYKKAQQL